MICPGCGLELVEVTEHVARVHAAPLEALARSNEEVSEAKVVEFVETQGMWTGSGDGIAIVRKVAEPDGGYI